MKIGHLELEYLRGIKSLGGVVGATWRPDLDTRWWRVQDQLLRKELIVKRKDVVSLTTEAFKALNDRAFT